MGWKDWLYLLGGLILLIIVVGIFYINIEKPKSSGCTFSYGWKGKEFSDVTSYNSCNLSNYVAGYEWIKNNVPKDAAIFT
ncbi:MAG: hypothetical protein AABW75_03900 [Nanoarchaeota archaeon]